jgi:hypothetical protein
MGCAAGTLVSTHSGLRVIEASLTASAQIRSSRSLLMKLVDELAIDTTQIAITSATESAGS